MDFLDTLQKTHHLNNFGSFMFQRYDIPDILPQILYNFLKNINVQWKDIYTETVIIICQAFFSHEDCLWDIDATTLGGSSIRGRPRKNQELLIGRAGRNAIETEDIARESLRWQRRRQTIEKFKENQRAKEIRFYQNERVNGSGIYEAFM